VSCSRCEVVDCDPDAELFERGEPFDGFCGVPHQRGFGDLDRQRVGRESALGDCVVDVVCDPALVELAGGDVDGDPDLVAAAVPVGCLPAGFLEDPASDRDDQAGSLCGWDEEVGADHASVWVLPADQCFDTGDLFGSEVEGRLVDEEELLLVDGGAEVDLEPSLIGFELLHAGLEQQVAVSACFLGPVEGDVGVAEQLVRLWRTATLLRWGGRTRRQP